MELFFEISLSVKGTNGTSLNLTSLNSTTGGVMKSHISLDDLRPFSQVLQSIQNVP